MATAAAAARQRPTSNRHSLRWRRGPTWGRSRTDSGAAPRRPGRELCLARVYVSATPRATLRRYGARREALCTSSRRASTDAPSSLGPLCALQSRACVRDLQPHASYYIILILNILNTASFS
ncbi:unnamed protein product [Diatraea saccharalis]|uniref:Uncharacterized protein n=1 Tax=Diatraea saccharalis TaxID=40085 RepID=A0A9N9RCP2_9NEOP|nr:unnamed protein product [Diatraea saccharalis]